MYMNTAPLRTFKSGRCDGAGEIVGNLLGRSGGGGSGGGGGGGRFRCIFGRREGEDVCIIWGNVSGNGSHVQHLHGFLFFFSTAGPPHYELPRVPRRLDEP